MYDSSRAVPPPDPNIVGSFPRRTPPSRMRERYTTGIPKTRYGGGTSIGSSPAQNAMKKGRVYDPFRESMDPNLVVPAPIDRDHVRLGTRMYNPGPPSDSPFARMSNNYKDLEVTAMSSQDRYNDMVEEGYANDEDVAENPFDYSGLPRELRNTREWHAEMIRPAKVAEANWKRVGEARTAMGRAFIGYDTRRGGQGHGLRVKLVERRRKAMARRAKDHDTWSNN